MQCLSLFKKLMKSREIPLSHLKLYEVSWLFRSSVILREKKSIIIFSFLQNNAFIMLWTHVLNSIFVNFSFFCETWSKRNVEVYRNRRLHPLSSDRCDRHISSIVMITFVTEITDRNRYTWVLGPEDGKPFPNPRRIFGNHVFYHSMICRNFRAIAVVLLKFVISRHLRDRLSKLKFIEKLLL
jgi:hypothetical protein